MPGMLTSRLDWQFSEYRVTARVSGLLLLSGGLLVHPDWFVKGIQRRFACVFDVPRIARYVLVMAVFSQLSCKRPGPVRSL